tara:strand:- start:1824 stop:2459 length:636 start_codon:yes stop_codon:yes gene_type:complete
MTTPFSIPNLNQYVKTGSDAELNSVTFSDGTKQTTASSGGGGGALEFDQAVMTETSTQAVPYDTPYHIADLKVEFSLDGTESEVVLLMGYSICGSWDSTQTNKGMRIDIEKPNGDMIVVGGAADGDRSRVLDIFHFPQNHSSVPMSANGTISWTLSGSDIESGTYSVIPLLMNTYSSGTATFYFNRTILDNDHQAYERLVSNCWVQVKKKE